MTGIDATRHATHGAVAGDISSSARTRRLALIGSAFGYAPADRRGLYGAVAQVGLDWTT